MELPPPPVSALVRPTAQVAPFLAQINWTPPRGGRAPLVAVLDTGVDPATPVLAGVVDAERARSFVPESPDPLSDQQGHGTHVAATIAAVAGARPGRPGVRILPVTVAAADGTTTSPSLVRGLRYATARRARVINISFGGQGFSRAEQNAIFAATRAGALVIVAAGNSGNRGGPPEFPGAYTQVIAVGALGARGRPLGISARGPQIALAAPGQDIPVTLSDERGGQVEQRTGTSMAAAVTSGAAARILARAPRLSPAQVRTLLETTATDVPPRGRDVGTGAGALNLRAALVARIPPPEDIEPNDNTVQAAANPPLLSADGPDARTIRGRTGSWGDPRDGFRVHLRSGQRLIARLGGPARADLDLVLWRVGTPAATRTPAFGARWIAGASLGPTSTESLDVRATRAGFYTLEVQGSREPAYYRLTVQRRPG